MTTPVFTNNASTTLAVTTTAAATTITVTDASVFNVLIQDGAGATNNLHEMATLTDGTNIEIVQVTNANTTTDVITVVRAQEETTGYAFLLGDTIEGRLTAETLRGGFFGAEPRTSSGPILGDYAVDLVTLRDTVLWGATGASSTAIGASARAAGANSIALGTGSEAMGNNSINIGGANTSSSSATYTIAIGYTSDVQAAADYGIAIGNTTNIGAINVIAIGRDAVAIEDDAIAIGRDSTAHLSALSGIAIGSDSYVNANYGIAIGDTMQTSIAKTHKISGCSLVSNDAGQTDETLYFAGQENIIFSQEYDFTLTLADNVITIEIPTGSTFFVTEVGIMPTVINTVTTPPTIEFGTDTTTAAIMTAQLVTTETVTKRERFSRELASTGWVSGSDETGATSQLTVSVTVAATATSYSARCYFKGFLLEDE